MYSVQTLTSSKLTQKLKKSLEVKGQHIWPWNWQASQKKLFIIDPGRIKSHGIAPLWCWGLFPYAVVLGTARPSWDNEQYNLTWNRNRSLPTSFPEWFIGPTIYKDCMYLPGIKLLANLYPYNLQTPKKSTQSLEVTGIHIWRWNWKTWQRIVDKTPWEENSIWGLPSSDKIK